MKIVKWGYLLLFLSMQLTCFAPQNEFYLEIREYHVQNALQQIQNEKRLDALLVTLRKIESRERYQIRGSSNEYGAYQFTRNTWNRYCFLFFGKVLDITNMDNQDLVAKKKVEMFINAGYSDAEIFSLWNCGSPQWQGKVGINQWGVRYDVPAYVARALTILSTIKNDSNYS